MQPEKRGFRRQLVGAELEAIANLLHVQAEAWFQKKHSDVVLQRRLQGLRKSVRSGLSIEWLTREILIDEFDALHPAVEQIDDQYRSSNVRLTHALATCTVEGKDGKPVRVKRPLPIPRTELTEPRVYQLRKPRGGKKKKVPLCDLFGASRRGTKVLTKLVVRARFWPLSMSQIDRARRKGKRKPMACTTNAQKLLASVFLDVASFELTPERRRMMERILNALRLSGYDPFGLFYLVHTAQRLNEPIALGHCTSLEVGRLCRAVCGPKNDFNRGPFTGLIA